MCECDLFDSVSCSVMSDSATPWTAAHQALLSMGFSRQEYWNGLTFPSPGDLPNPGIELPSPADSSPSEPPGELLFKDKIPHLKSLGFQEEKGIFFFFLQDCHTVLLVHLQRVPEEAWQGPQSLEGPRGEVSSRACLSVSVFEE